METRPEIRGRCKPDLYNLVMEAAEFTGATPFEFVLTAGLEKAREIVLEKAQFEKIYSETRAVG